ncbi:MAG: PAS domain S-box protein [Verrucomicrobia bacterium]|nr:PAS domain S-box protein [Verrucomicrobiota bacterium]
MKTYRRSLFARFRSHAWLLAGAWTAIIAGSLFWNLDHHQRHTIETARNIAQIAFENDILYRHWVSEQGGLYARVSDRVRPNPYLTVPDRDVTTTAGVPLTLLNPAYLARLVNESSDAARGTRGHLASLKPLRPENAPDPWEAAALRSFELGVKETNTVERMRDGEHLRLMRPFVTEQRCLRCHAAQGYRAGDIRGGISISVPLAALRVAERPVKDNFILAHAGLWLLGLAGIGISRRSLGKEVFAREQAEERLRDFNAALEQRIKDQTAEIRKANDTLEQRIAERTAEIEAANAELRESRLAALNTADDALAARERAEESAAALRASEERFRDIASASADWIWETDVHGRYTFASGSVKDVLGYEPGEILGRTPFDLMAPDEAARVRAEFQAFADWRKPFRDFANDCLHKDGGIRHILTSGVPVFDAEGSLRGYRGVDKDITERKRGEAALRHTFSLLRATLQSTADGVLVVNADGKIGEFNQRFIDLWRIPENILAANNDGVTLAFVTDQLRNPEAFMAKVRELYATPEQTSEDVLEFKDGRIFERYSQPQWLDGRVVGRVWSFRDVTERRFAEKALRRHDMIQAGVNQVLSAALACKTEAELGSACLAVTKLITQSKAGFIGEIKADGLQEIAVSNPGWDACKGLRPAGQSPPPASFEIHGLYGRVIKDAKGFFTNDPAQHPDGIGLPDSHPPLHSFLGVPLIREGRVIGMIALGNRDGGYTATELETLEAMAPAIVEAFLRKRAEQELFAANQRLTALLNALPVGVSFSDDATCQRITGNPAVLAQFEVRPEDNLSASAPDAAAPGRQVRFFRDGQPMTDADLPLQQAVAGNREIPPVELEVHLPSGRRWFADASGAPLRDSAGSVVGGIAVTVDITARKQAEEKLRKSNQELERFNRAMVGRELRMVELKKEVNKLLTAAGRPPRYTISGDTEQA